MVKFLLGSVLTLFGVKWVDNQKDNKALSIATDVLFCLILVKFLRRK